MRMEIHVFKKERKLVVRDGMRELFIAQVALGLCPQGHKRREGDGKTPEGRYHICLIKPQGKYGPSLGLSYPNGEDARLALTEGRIRSDTCAAICAAEQERKRPPWGTPLGGEIYLHGGGAQRDWTQGCIALEDADMEALFSLAQEGQLVEIHP